MLVNGLPAGQALTGEVLGAAPVLFLVGGVVGYLSDLRRKLAEELAARQQVELALRVSEAFNQAVLQALSANIAVLSRTGEIIAVNGAWKKFARDNDADEGRTGVGMNYLQVCRNSTGEGTESALQVVMGIQSVLEGRDALFTMEYSCHAPGQKRWYVMHVTPLMHDQGGAVVSHINITDRVLSEQKLAYLATHDALTGLYNRAFFELETARLQQAQSAPVSVVIADIDGLKQVNDQQGHAAGDALLRRAADVLRSAFRDEDVLARIGGDEFAVILPGMDEHLAQLIPDRVALRMREATLHESPEDAPLRISLGVATAARSEDLPAAVKLADEKMYQEKEAKKRDS
jgi:diguanylate cyclase (GGDEF)-like protein